MFRDNTIQNLKAWYLIYTKPLSEIWTNENLNRQAYEAYIPMMEVSHRRNGQYVKHVEPMFSNYLFINLITEY